MEILRRPMGPLETNSYVFRVDDSCIVIDPGFPKESVELAEYLLEKDVKVEYIIATHGHFDHVLGIDSFKERLGYKTVFQIHVNDLNLLSSAGEALERFFNIYIPPPKPDKFLYGGEKLTLNGVQLEIIHTPGHTRGSICIYIPDEKILFTGDTLFRGSIGRIDFPESSPDDMVKSLKIISGLDPETRIYPGHGEESILKQEIELNQPLRELLGFTF